MLFDDDPHKQGRPYRGTGPTQTLSLRFTDEELQALRAASKKRNVPMAILMRRAMAEAGLFNAAASG